jgi:pimeloyl-ACP methyl ester carboxylesterase
VLTRAAVTSAGLYYEQAGDGVPVLLIHPSGATASTWGGVVAELAAHGQVITYDRRGYARTGGEPVRSIAAHTADTAALLDELGVSAAVVVGTSVGGTIAIDLARQRPDLVRTVVSHESPWHVTRQPPTRRELVALLTMSWLSRRHRYPEAAAAFLRFAYGYRGGGSAWDRFPDEWRQVVADNALASLADIRIAIADYPTAGQLAAVTAPVVCSHGSRCPAKMVRVTRRLAAAIPSATVQEVEGAGHAAPFDAPANFAAMVIDVVTAA